MPDPDDLRRREPLRPDNNGRHDTVSRIELPPEYEILLKSAEISGTAERFTASALNIMKGVEDLVLKVFREQGAPALYLLTLADKVPVLRSFDPMLQAEIKREAIHQLAELARDCNADIFVQFVSNFSDWQSRYDFVKYSSLENPLIRTRVLEMMTTPRERRDITLTAGLGFYHYLQECQDPKQREQVVNELFTKLRMVTALDQTPSQRGLEAFGYALMGYFDYTEDTMDRQIVLWSAWGRVTDPYAKASLRLAISFNSIIEAIDSGDETRLQVA